MPSEGKECSHLLNSPCRRWLGYRREAARSQGPLRTTVQCSAIDGQLFDVIAVSNENPRAVDLTILGRNPGWGVENVCGCVFYDFGVLERSLRPLPQVPPKAELNHHRSLLRRRQHGSRLKSTRCRHGILTPQRAESLNCWSSPCLCRRNSQFAAVCCLHGRSNKRSKVGSYQSCLPC